MARRPSTQSNPGLIDTHINTAFDDVKKVGDNIEHVINCSENMEDIINVSGNIGLIDEAAKLVPFLDEIETVADNITDIVTVADSLNDPKELPAIFANLPEILEADNNALIATQQADRAESEADRAQGIADGIENSRTQIQLNKDNIEALDTRVTTNEADILALQNDATNLEPRVTQAEADIDALEGRNIITALNSGLTGGGDLLTDRNLEVDILATSEATSANGADVFLLETPTGNKFRITRDNLLAGLGKGSELRGSSTPLSTAPQHITSLTITGDPDNSTISQGVAPVATIPSGYTYVMLLDPSDFPSGVTIRMTGNAGDTDDIIVFDQDQLQWVGSALDGSWVHLETGNAVISVHGRQGLVVSQPGDYNAGQITSTLGNVQNDLNTLAATDVQQNLDIDALEVRVGDNETAITDLEQRATNHETDITDILDGTTPPTEAVNADTVDGEHAAEFMHLAGNEIVTGVKTFNAMPILPINTYLRDIEVSGRILFHSNTTVGDEQGATYIRGGYGVGTGDILRIGDKAGTLVANIPFDGLATAPTHLVTKSVMDSADAVLDGRIDDVTDGTTPVGKVTVTDEQTENASYPVVWNKNADDLFDTDGKFNFNPSTGTLEVTNIDASGINSTRFDGTVLSLVSNGSTLSNTHDRAKTAAYWRNVNAATRMGVLPGQLTRYDEGSATDFMVFDEGNLPSATEVTSTDGNVQTDLDALDTRLGTAEGDITTLDGEVVKLTGDQSISGIKTMTDVDTTATFKVPETSRTTGLAGQIQFHPTEGFQGHDGTEWGAIGGGAGTPVYLIKTANYSIQPEEGVLVNITTAPVTISLPTSPEVGDWVSIGDYNGTANVVNPIVISSFDNIHGESDDLYITSGNTVLTLSYIDATVGWKIVDGIGEGSEGTAASVIETGRTATSWYRKWSDGFIEQGGRGTATTAGVVNTLPIPFASEPITVTGNHFGGSSLAVVFNTYTSTSFKAVAVSASPVNIHWTASGY